MSMQVLKFRHVHANVTEQCMRKPHVAGKRVGVDALLVTARANRVHLAAVYWALPKHVFEPDHFPEIYEAHFYLEDGNLREFTPTVPTEWNAFSWKITADGDLKYIS